MQHSMQAAAQAESAASWQVTRELTLVSDLDSSPPRGVANEPALSIVVLAFQEEGRIGRSLIELSAHLTRTGRSDVEVLVVAASRPDGSSDRTGEIVEGKRPLFEDLRVIRPGVQAGKGRDARVGMLTARGAVRVFMDADLATPLHHLDTALHLVGTGHQTVIGVRDLTSSHRGFRKIISSLGNLLVQAVLLPGVPDTQCGFKLFSAAAAESIFSRQTIDGWGFDMEVLTIARRLGCGITTLPIPDWVDVAGGTFETAPLRGSLRTLQDLLAIKWRELNGRYGAGQRAPAVVAAPTGWTPDQVTRENLATRTG